MTINELVQSYEKNSPISFQEALQTSLTSWHVYFTSFCVMVLITVFFIFLMRNRTKYDGQISKKAMHTTMAIGLVLGLFVSVTAKKITLQKVFNEEWNTKYVKPFLQEQKWKKQEVTNVTFDRKTMKISSSLKEGKNKSEYEFTGFIRSEDGELIEEEFIAETLKEDLKEGERPYIEFKYLPKTVNADAKKGRYYLIFHVNEETIQWIM